MQLAEYPSDFNHLLHAIRVEQMKGVDARDQVMVSVGCNSRYYFDMIDGAMGAPSRHIGLEAYVPKPDELPPHVDWVCNTAGNMSQVASGSADLVFAGQTVEHLWAEELAAFMLESWRVLKPGGRLVLDSPNEAVTHALKWNHPEHTIEFACGDAEQLLQAAGFTVDKAVGHWLCRDGDGMLPLLPDLSPPSMPVDRRVRDGLSRPQDCFSWWMEARKTGVPDAAAVIREVRALWHRYGGSRVQRLMQTRATDLHHRGTETWAHAPAGWASALVFGPHMPLPPGRVSVCFDVDSYAADASPGWIEIFRNEPGKEQVLAMAPLPKQHLAANALHVAVDLPSTVFGNEFRLWTNGVCALTARVGVTIFVANP